jgi:hypothetical protein
MPGREEVQEDKFDRRAYKRKDCEAYNLPKKAVTST